MYAVGFKRRPGDLGTTAIVPAYSPAAALEKPVDMFPEYRRAGRPGHTFEIEYAEIYWDTGQDFVIQARKRPPDLLPYNCAARRGPWAGNWREGCICGRNSPCQLPLFLAA